MSVLDDVNVTVTALGVETIDAAAVALAKMYARQLDQAAVVRAQAERAFKSAERDGDEALMEQVTMLRTKLSERETVDRIGARLHALLVELQATPKARGGIKRVKQTSTLAHLRAVR